MASHNTWVHGNIGKDIELRYGSNGTPIAKFSIAVSEKYNGEEKTTWYNCVAFKTTAENLAKFFSKGSEIIVTGNMSFGSYEKEGQKFYTAELIIRTFDFCGKKGDNQPQAPANNFQNTGTAQNQGFQQSNQQTTGQQGFQAQQNNPNRGGF